MLCDNLERGRMGAGRENQKGRDICILIAEAHCCTTMFVSPVRNKFKKKSVPTGDDGCPLNLLQQSLHDVYNIMLYNLNLYSALCQVYLNKTRRKKKIRNIGTEITLFSFLVIAVINYETIYLSCM